MKTDCPRIIGPDGLDLGPDLGPYTNISRKFRWVARLYKDAHQVSKAEFVRVSTRPPLLISVTADKSWNGGGEMSITFSRTGVEVCDEIWLGLIGGGGEVIEEWELCNIKKLACENEETLEFGFEHMRYKCNVKTGFGDMDKDIGKWTNWST